jgi:CheY-like chemotaxis protein
LSLHHQPTDEVNDDVDENALRGIRILTVDDDPYCRELLERTLSDVGATVLTSGSSREVLQKLEEFRPHLLISDVGMPEEDGFSLVRRLRSLDGWKARLPAIALTALSRPEDRERALEAGYDEHLGKPFDPGLLCMAISRLLSSTVSRA